MIFWLDCIPGLRGCQSPDLGFCLEDAPHLPEQLLLQAVELTKWAPNGGNRQPWYFYIIVSKDIINSIADATWETAQYVATGQKRPSWEMATTMAQRTGAFRSAPAAIAAAVRKYQSPLDQVLAARAKVGARAAQIRQGGQP